MTDRAEEVPVCACAHAGARHVEKENGARGYCLERGCHCLGLRRPKDEQR